MYLDQYLYPLISADGNVVAVSTGYSSVNFFHLGLQYKFHRYGSISDSWIGLDWIGYFSSRRLRIVIK